MDTRWIVHPSMVGSLIEVKKQFTLPFTHTDDLLSTKDNVLDCWRRPEEEEETHVHTENTLTLQNKLSLSHTYCISSAQTGDILAVRQGL